MFKKWKEKRRKKAEEEARRKRKKMAKKICTEKYPGLWELISEDDPEKFHRKLINYANRDKLENGEDWK